MRFIAKPDTWFDEGTEVKLVVAWPPPEGVEMSHCPIGIFSGLVDGKLDEELCGYDEFEIIDE